MFRPNDDHKQMSLFTSASDMHPAVARRLNESWQGVPDPWRVSRVIGSSHELHGTSSRGNENGFYPDHEQHSPGWSPCLEF